MKALLIAFFLPCLALADAISFNERFPDTALRGRSFDIAYSSDYVRACELKSQIICKQAEADAFVLSCPPNSKDWREQVEHWNQLRRQNFEFMKQLRAIVSL
jgi:hypothetical protein